MSIRLTIRAYLSSFFPFQEANHSQLIEGLKQLPKYPKPRKRYEGSGAKGQSVKIATPQPAAPARGDYSKILKLDDWFKTYAADHKRDVA